MASATYIGADTTTKGSWKGVYGTTGYFLAETSAGVSSLPSWCSGVTLTGETFFSFSSFTDPAAEPDNGNTTGTFLNIWYSGTSWTIEIDQSATTYYDLSLYLIDADNAGRTCTVTVYDTSNVQLAPTQSYSAMEHGIWSRWKISGSVKIVLTNTGPNNVDSSGFLFDPASGATPQVWPYLDTDLAGMNSMGMGV